MTSIYMGKSHLSLRAGAARSCLDKRGCFGCWVTPRNAAQMCLCHGGGVTSPAWTSSLSGVFSEGRTWAPRWEESVHALSSHKHTHIHVLWNLKTGKQRKGALAAISSVYENKRKSCTFIITFFKGPMVLDTLKKKRQEQRGRKQHLALINVIKHI